MWQLRGGIFFWWRHTPSSVELDVDEHLLADGGDEDHAEGPSVSAVEVVAAAIGRGAYATAVVPLIISFHER